MSLLKAVQFLESASVASEADAEDDHFKELAEFLKRATKLLCLGDNECLIRTEDLADFCQLDKLTSDTNAGKFVTVNFQSEFQKIFDQTGINLVLVVQEIFSDILHFLIASLKSEKIYSVPQKFDLLKDSFRQICNAETISEQFRDMLNKFISNLLSILTNNSDENVANRYKAMACSNEATKILTIIGNSKNFNTFVLTSVFGKIANAVSYFEANKYFDGMDNFEIIVLHNFLTIIRRIMDYCLDNKMAVSPELISDYKYVFQKLIVHGSHLPLFLKSHIRSTDKLMSNMFLGSI